MRNSGNKAIHKKPKSAQRQKRHGRAEEEFICNKAPFPISLSRASDEVLVDVNEAWMETFGFTRAEAIGKTMAEIGISKDPLKQASLYSLLQEKGSLRNIEVTGYCNKEKAALVLLENLEIIEIGKEKFLFISAQDITERKKIEESLQEYNDHLRMALEATHLGTWKYNPRTREIFWDERSLMILGGSDDLSDINKFMELIHPEDKNRVNDTVRNGLNPSKGTGVIDFRIIRADGEVRWVNLTGKSYFEWNGSRYKAVHSIGTNMDITDRKRAEEALIESEERLRLATEAANLFGWEVDLTSEEFKTSENAEQVAGFPMPKYLSEAWEYIHPEDLAKVKKAIYGAIEKKMEFRIEYRIKSQYPSREIWLFSAGVPITGIHENPVRVVGVTQNITESKEAENMLRRWNESLEQQVTERTELAEARTKQLQVLALDLVEAEERERKRISALLHDDLQQLLVSARLQQQTACNALPDDSPQIPTLLNVDALLEQSIEKSRRLSHELSPPVLHHSGLIAGLKWLVRQMNDQFGLRVKLEADTGLSIEDSPLKVFLFRAVQELLFNIVKHAGVKDARVTIERLETDLLVAVIDKGMGFDAEILESPFMTTGFGIFSLQERIRAFGGDLIIETAPGTGSKFILKIPLNIVQINESLQSIPAVDSNKPVVQTRRISFDSNRNIRVLFADDHKVMRQALIAMLKDQPDIHVVGEAANGREALEQVRSLNPDVVVMDVSMPEMDGVQATRQIKDERPEVRVIGLSMYDDDQIIHTMQQAGAEGFVSKTASSHELLQAIYGIR